MVFYKYWIKNILTFPKKAVISLVGNEKDLRTVL